MAMRFRKSFKLAPGVKLNLGKKSIGLSLGNKLGGITANTRSGVHRRTSLPGTGISFIDKVGGNKKSRTGKAGTADRGSVEMAAGSSEKKPFYKKWWVIALAVLAVIGAIGGAGDKSQPAVVPTDVPAVTATAELESRSLPVAAAEPTDKPAVTVSPTTAPTVAPVRSATADKVFVGSVDSDKYHDPGCQWAKEINPENEIWFATADEAKAAGYSPCGVCWP